MEINRITSYTESFNAIANHIEGENGEKVEVWFARDLQSRLGYARWENFQVAIGRAVESCKSQNINVDDHFREVTKMVECSDTTGFTGPHFLRVKSSDYLCKYYTM